MHESWTPGDYAGKSMTSERIRTICIIVFVLFVTTVVIFIYRPASFRRAQDVCNHEEYDRLSRRFFFLGDPNFLVPKNHSAMDQFCGDQEHITVELIGQTVKCHERSYERSYRTVALLAGKQLRTSICESSKTKQEFLENMSCIKDDTMPRVRDFMNQTQAEIDRLEKPASKRRCSAYLQELVSQLDGTVEQFCSKQELDFNATRDYLKTVIRSLVNGMLTSSGCAPNERRILVADLT